MPSQKEKGRERIVWKIELIVCYKKLDILLENCRSIFFVQ
jgi:hypothetical protein